MCGCQSVISWAGLRRRLLGLVNGVKEGGLHGAKDPSDVGPVGEEARRREAEELVDRVQPQALAEREQGGEARAADRGLDVCDGLRRKVGTVCDGTVALQAPGLAEATDPGGQLLRLLIREPALCHAIQSAKAPPCSSRGPRGEARERRALSALRRATYPSIARARPRVGSRHLPHHGVDLHAWNFTRSQPEAWWAP